jgi:outer membrane protein OmpA-like peptidoglycan-associated protein
MKKTIITLAAALALGAPFAAFAQEEDPNAPPVVIPDQQQAPQAEEQSEQPVKKSKKKQETEQSQEAEPPAAEQVEQPQEQVEEPVKKRKKKEQAEQPQEEQPQATEQVEQPPVTEPPATEQVEQPVKKRKKKEQAEQPQETQPPATEQVERPSTTEPTATEQVEQPVKKRKKKEQAEQPTDQTQPPAEQTTEQPQTEQPVTAEVPPEVTQYLSDTRPASELSDEELAQRARRGRDLARTKGLSDDLRQQLAAEAKRARTEAMARQKAGKSDGEQPTAEQPAGQPPATGEATKGDQQPVQGEGQTAQPTDQANQPVVNPDAKQVQQLDGNKASPEAEAKAKAYLDDTRPADQLKDDELRARLEGMRDLMAGNQLSRESERALRRKLRAERDILRNRVAEKVVVEEKQDEELPTKQRRRDRDASKWDNWSERDILRDRRRSEDLEEGELRRRIDIYRDAIDDDQYDDEERSYWRDMMERDRRYLRGRMVGDRQERERYWRDRRDRNEINIDLNIDLGAKREEREAVFMDEIDDEELEDYLVAAPRRKIARRYTVEEIEDEPEVRMAMPAIEVDNVRFGFNEAFVREEEVEKLDRIAEVIEKILAAHPGEVFMIEGHTDAVGSDAYNLKLSRARAEAVKKALTTYYVVPARNLKAVGYGERYLKIPTSDAEEENRRVSMRRVTPLVGEAEDE